MSKDFKDIDRRARKKARRQQQMDSGASLATRVHGKRRKPTRDFDWRKALEEVTAEEEHDLSAEEEE